MTEYKKQNRDNFYDDVTEIEFETEIVRPVKVPTYPVKDRVLDNSAEEVTTIELLASEKTGMVIGEWFGKSALFFSRAKTKIQQLFDHKTCWNFNNNHAHEDSSEDITTIENLQSDKTGVSIKEWFEKPALFFSKAKTKFRQLLDNTSL